jgi:hypothetical protein
VGAGSPKPKKSSATSAPILATTTNGAKEMAEVSELGKICLKMMDRSEAPMAMAAPT